VYAGFKNGEFGAEEGDIQLPGQIERILRDRLSAGDHHSGGADHIRRADNLGGVEGAEQKDVLFVRCQDIAHQARRYNPPCKFPASPVQEFPLHPGSGFINKNFRTHDFHTFFFDQECQRKTSEKECTAGEKILFTKSLRALSHISEQVKRRNSAAATKELTRGRVFLMVGRQ
jgi:hypothetical protein